MILARNVTRSFSMYQEVEITEELLERIEQAGFEIDLEDIIHTPNKSASADIWDILDEMHWIDGDVIFKEYEPFPNQDYDDVCEYLIIDKSALIEKEAIN